jgi:rhodanese-related sulfurtransferase
MNQFLEYAQSNALLLSATVLLALLAGFVEWRHRRGGGTRAISGTEAVALMNKAGALVLDVRDAKEYEAGHITNARNIPAGELAGKIDTLKKYREKPVIVYCENGSAAAGASQTLRTQGFAQVVTLRGGLGGWRQDNLPLVKGNLIKRKDGKAA